MISTFQISFTVNGKQKRVGYSLIEDSIRARQFKEFIEDVSPVRFTSNNVLGDLQSNKASFECKDEDEAEYYLNSFIKACDDIVKDIQDLNEMF